jgi:hypothetical protein
MLTEEDKRILLGLIDSVEIKGNLKNIGAMLEKLGTLRGKVEALPTEAPKEEKPAKKK